MLRGVYMSDKVEVELVVTAVETVMVEAVVVVLESVLEVHSGGGVKYSLPGSSK